MNIVAVLADTSYPLEHFFHQQGWQVARSRVPGMGQAPIMVQDRLDDSRLESCLEEPWVGGIELAGSDLRPLSSCFLRHLSEGGLGLALRSDTAYTAETARIFAQALARRLLAADVDTDDLEFVLHEMISNALLHGNFGIAGHFACDEAGLELFERQIDQALGSEDTMARRILISATHDGHMLEVAVEDVGDGFCSISLEPDPLRPHGLDFVSEIVNQYRSEENGRRAIATLRLPPRQKPKLSVGMQEAHVLIVDDKKLNRDLLQALLTAMGVGRIRQAEGGEQALDIIAADRPDLILLDVIMPGMDGYATCRSLRRHYSLSELPVIFITALDGPSDRFACFAAGGNDVISKPLNNAEVIARVGVHLQLGLIMAKLNVFQARVHDELQRARSAQLSLVPTPLQIEAINERTGLLIEGLMATSSELGGDFWTLLDAGENRICLLLADFTGHGTAAAFNVFRLHLLLSRLPQESIGSPSRLLERLNSELRHVLKPGEFAAVFAALIDVEAEKMTYCGAATPAPVLVEGGQPRFLECDGPPLGAFDSPEFEEWETPFPPGSQLLAYSDGLVESVADGQLVCSDERLLSWVAEEQPSGCLASAVLERFSAILPGEPPDDLTLVSVCWPGKA